MGRDVAGCDSEADTDGVAGGAYHGGDLGTPDGVPPDGRLDVIDRCGVWGDAGKEVT